MQSCFLNSFSGSLPCSPPHIQLFALCTKSVICFCYIVLLCALTNLLKLNACRIEAYSETEDIFSGCLASVALCFDLRAVFCLIHVSSSSTNGIEVLFVQDWFKPCDIRHIIRKLQVLLRISFHAFRFLICAHTRACHRQTNRDWESGTHINFIGGHQWHMQLLHRARRFPSSPLA